MRRKCVYDVPGWPPVTAGRDTWQVMSTPQTEPTGRAGRYQRSAIGLITSLVVTVIGLGALFYFTGLFRNDLEIKPEAIDYADTIESVQRGGLEPVYPATLPEGWIATGVDVDPEGEPVFMLRMLTDDERYVAVRQEDASPVALARASIDEDAVEADGYQVPSTVTDPVARDWKGFADDGGDRAYVAEYGDDSLIVFGSASAKELQQIIDSLVTTPID